MRKIPPMRKKAQDAPNAIPERRKTAKTVDVDVGSIVQHIYQIHWGCHETAVGGQDKYTNILYRCSLTSNSSKCQKNSKVSILYYLTISNV